MYFLSWYFKGNCIVGLCFCIVFEVDVVDCFLYFFRKCRDCIVKYCYIVEYCICRGVIDGEDYYVDFYVGIYWYISGIYECEVVICGVVVVNNVVVLMY